MGLHRKESVFSAVVRRNELEEIVEMKSDRIRSRVGTIDRGYLCLNACALLSVESSNEGLIATCRTVVDRVELKRAKRGYTGLLVNVQAPKRSLLPAGDVATLENEAILPFRGCMKIKKAM